MNVEEVQRRLWEQSKTHKENREATSPLFPTSPYEMRIRNLSDLIHQPDWLNEAASRGERLPKVGNIFQENRGKTWLNG